jgi:hypothetical protein
VAQCWNVAQAQKAEEGLRSPLLLPPAHPLGSPMEVVIPHTHTAPWLSALPV